MSHWQSSKLNLVCSMAVLKRALLNIMPDWAGHIREDASSNLEAENRYGQGTKKGYKIVVKLQYGDIGFKQNEDGTWMADYEPMVLPNAMRRSGGVEAGVMSEVAAMKAKAIAQMKGYRVESDTTQGNTRTIRTLIPANQLPGAQLA